MVNVDLRHRQPMSIINYQLATLLTIVIFIVNHGHRNLTMLVTFSFVTLLQNISNVTF
jgi:hypothetical protein